MNKNGMLFVFRKMGTILVILFLASTLVGTSPVDARQSNSQALQTSTFRVGTQPGNSQYDLGALAYAGTIQEVDNNEGVENRVANLVQQLGITNDTLQFIRNSPLQQTQVSSSTALVVDVSGSMDQEDGLGRKKIDSAKSAAQMIIDMLEQESQLSATDHEVGIASFTSDSYRLLDLTTDYNRAGSVIDGLTPLNGTNIGAGITTGNVILSQASTSQTKIMILLSDGMSNVGLSDDDILSGPVQDAVRAGTCIYTVGFGDVNNLNEELLRRIASASGCGQYYYATDVIELERVYILIRHQSTGVVLADLTGTVSQGQTVQAGSVTVPTGQGELAITLHWAGSKMELILRDPNGAVVPLTDPNINIQSYANLVYAMILNPIPGTWLIDVVGVDIPQANEIFNVIVSARAAPPTPVPPTPTPQPTLTPVRIVEKTSGFPIALLFILLGGGGIGLYVYATVLKRRRAPGLAVAGSGAVAGNANLTILNGAQAGRVIPLSSDSISIGRSSSNQVQLNDRGISRLHAILRHTQDAWFIQDQGSTGGTYVNGQQVAATRLNHGDRILVGSTEMIFKAS